jgi:hypothetical protein
MKVKELMEVLSQFDGELPVLVSIDPDGNGFSMLEDHSLCRYEGGGYLCEVYLPDDELTQELIDQGYEESDLRPDYPLGVILWP